ncbi:FAD-dependent monooxygenase [Phytohabitans flavus]|uniref:FAD-dependent monooxygenase n=1 Tax=Phytohabitans flavus TaxID=1076124 RepID=UPI003626D335
MTVSPGQPRDILISGAGIAGPALAYWLHRYGFTPTVAERAPALREGGYAVDFRGPVHLDLLSRMGIRDEVEHARTGTGDSWYVNARGKKLARMPAEQTGGDVEILRGDLVRVLYEATMDETEYVFGDSITALEETADGVNVTFEHAAPRSFDLVIGADGLHSRVRSLAFGPERSYVKHLGLHCAIFTTPNYLALDHSGLVYGEPKRIVVYSARENTEARVLLYFASPPLSYDRVDGDRQRGIVHEAFAGARWETPRLLELMATAPDLYFDSVSTIKMDSWSRGRIALLGDAGYCPSSLSGVGTGLAVVGAYVLAGELATAGGDHATAFARYESAMRSYVDGCQKLADSASMMVPANRFLAGLMRLNMRMMPLMPWLRDLPAKMARRAASAITLPQYPTVG